MTQAKKGTFQIDGSEVALLPRTAHQRSKNSTISDGMRGDSETSPLLLQQLQSKPFFLTVLGSVVLGCACIVSAVVGLTIFLEADYFHDPGPYAQNSWCGYTPRTFWGLVAFALLPTIGFTLVYTGLSAALRATRGLNIIVAIAFLFFAFFALSVGAIGMVWGQETMKCLGVFCVDMTKYVEIPNARPEAGIGFLSVVGIAAFASLVPVSLTLIVIAYRHLSGSEPAPKPQGTNSFRSSESGAAALVFFVLIGLLGVTTLYIPNSWEYMVAARIAKNAKLIVTTDATVCNTYYNTYTCSEVPWSFMQTVNWQVSTNLNLKLYPSNLIFYGYLLSIVAFVGLARRLRAGRLFLKHHAFGTPFTYGELLLSTFTIAMVALFFTYWIHDHNYNGYWQGGSDPGVLPAERWARTTGQVAVIFLSLLFFPASRNSVVHKIFGTSWEASLWAHRVLGYCMLGATLAHIISWYKFYDIKGFFPRDIFDVPMMLPTSIDNFTVPLNSLAAFLMFLCMGVFALEPVRRRCFELFYYSHIIAAYFLIPAVLWHAAAGWEYLLPGLTVWFVDRVIRLYRGGLPAKLVDVKTFGDVTQLTFSHPSLASASPGQYVFINIAEISLFEWHPFTLSTSFQASAEGLATLHVKSMGSGTWTWKLLQLAHNAAAISSITLAVDGPNGTPANVNDYKKVILVAGGIGITPCASLFAHLKTDASKSSALLWTLREAEVASAFADHLSFSRRSSTMNVNASLSNNVQHTAKLFLTRIVDSSALLSELGPSVSILATRPRFAEELAAAALGYDPDDVLVFVCGPEAMVADVLSVAKAKKFHFHRETFLL